MGKVQDEISPLDAERLTHPAAVLTPENLADLEEDMADFMAGRLGRGPASYRRLPKVEAD